MQISFIIMSTIEIYLSDLCTATSLVRPNFYVQKRRLRAIEFLLAHQSREMGAVLVPIPPAVDSLENAFSCTLILGP